MAKISEERCDSESLELKNLCLQQSCSWLLHIYFYQS